jgi:lipopolysaccharide transport protein LptA
MASSRRNVLVALALAGTLGAPALAQDRSQLPIKVEARSSDFDYQANVLVFQEVTIVQGGIRITAARAVASGLDFEDSGWEFSGKVSISLPESGLTSDTARVRFAGGEIQSATVTGAPATFEQRQEKQLTQGRADRIDYDLARGTVELAGDAWLSDGRNEVAGATLVYSTQTQRVISNKPVVITINPGEAPPEAAPQAPPGTATPPEAAKPPE